MGTNHYFNHYGSHAEQRLIEDLVVESIKLYGADVYYIPNTNDAARDLIYGEDPLRRFTTTYPIEMYLSSALEYGGEKEFFSKFGLEIKNNVSVIVSRRSFKERVPQNTYTRPREGDLVYIPFLNGTGEIFEIKFVNQTKDFFMLGRKYPYFYELELEKFKYSQEIIATGTQDIDSVVTDSAYTIHLNTGAGSGNFLVQEYVFQSSDATYANATTIATVQSWTPSSNTLSVTNIAGVFTDGAYVYGATSGASYNLVYFDPLNNPAIKEVYDNEVTQQQANNYVVTTQKNALGSI